MTALCDPCADGQRCIECDERMCIDGLMPAITCDNHAGLCVDCARDMPGCSACDEAARYAS